MWPGVPPGAFVRKLETDDQDFKTSGPLKGDLFGFSTEDRIVLVLHNPTSKRKNLHIEEAYPKNATLLRQGQAAIVEGESSLFSDQYLEAALPPTGLLLIVSDRPPTRQTGPSSKEESYGPSLGK